jgi:hypothetical protein
MLLTLLLVDGTGVCEHVPETGRQVRVVNRKLFIALEVLITSLFQGHLHGRLA